jgi:Secretion system C-terminal sorting domain/Peptidase family C25
VQSKKGTVASINSTGLNYLAQGSDFLTNFYNNLFSKQDITIGSAVLQTKLQLETDNSTLDVIPRRYTLLGDPALKLPKNTITEIVKEQNNSIASYSLRQNYPNPFNPTTTINYSVAKESFISIKIYDLLGREITTLVNNMKNAGNYEIEFDGSHLSSGIYFYRMQAGNFSDTKKLILMK